MRRFEVHEQVIKILSIERIRASMKQAGTLIPDHVPRLEENSVMVASIIQEMEVPVFGDRLTNVHDD